MVKGPGPSDVGAKNTAFKRDGALASGKALKGNKSNGWIGFCENFSWQAHIIEESRYGNGVWKGML